MTWWSRNKNSILRYSFVATQAASGLAIFSVPLLNYFHPHKAEDESTQVETYTTTIAISMLAAAVYGFGANYFQGTYIANQAEKELEYNDDTVRTVGSNAAELTYIALRTSTLIFENIFIVSALKAYYLVLASKTDEQLASAPLTYLELAATLAYTLAAELPLVLATEGVESCKQLKRHITGSDNNPLIYILLRPLACCGGRQYIKTIGTASHVAGHASEILLLVPAHAYLRLLQHSPYLFGLAASSHAALSLYLITFCALQTYLFEANIGVQHLHHIEDNSADVISQTVQAPARYYNLVRDGLTAQAPLHGVSDAVTFTVFLRMCLKGKPQSTQAALITGPALFQFAASSAGNYASEIKESLNNLEYLPESKPLLKP